MSQNGSPTEVGLDARPFTRPWNRPDQTAPMPALAPTEAEVVVRRARRRRRRDDTQRIWHLSQGTPPVEPPRDALPVTPILAAPAPSGFRDPAPASRTPVPQAPMPPARASASPPLGWPFAATRPTGPFEDLTSAYDRPLRRWGRRLLSLFRSRRR